MTMRISDPDRLASLALQVWGYKQGEVVSLMIHLGDRLGLYRAMAGQGPITAASLAARTGLHERWLLEWLRGQAAAGLLDTADGEVFELSPEAAEVLADEEGSLWFAAGAFQGGMAPPDVVDRLADAFRTGRGLTYDDLGPSAAHGVERMLAPWTRLALVPRILPALDGVWARLTNGGRVADVGCGSGVALLTTGGGLPELPLRWIRSVASRHGPGPCSPGRDWPDQRRAACGGGRPSSRTDQPTTSCSPSTASTTCPARPRRSPPSGGAIAADGTWLIKDIRAGATWSDNQRNPMLAMMYGTSVATCMSSALSEPGGAGLGTLGFHRELAETMCRQAGFTRFSVHDFDDPANLYYEVRP